VDIQKVQLVERIALANASPQRDFGPGYQQFRIYAYEQRKQRDVYLLKAVRDNSPSLFLLFIAVRDNSPSLFLLFIAVRDNSPSLFFLFIITGVESLSFLCLIIVTLGDAEPGVSPPSRALPAGASILSFLIDPLNDKLLAADLIDIFRLKRDVALLKLLINDAFLGTSYASCTETEPLTSKCTTSLYSPCRII
jgi:hypothetical protein